MVLSTSRRYGLIFVLLASFTGLLAEKKAVGQSCVQGPALVCQVQLYYRPVVVGGVYVANHTFWYQAVYDDNTSALTTDSVVDGGPSSPHCSQKPCILLGWESIGHIGHYSEDDATTANLYYQSPGRSPDACTAVGALDTYPGVFASLPAVPYLSPPYNVRFQNSNTFSHWAANYASISVPGAPPASPGW